MRFCINNMRENEKESFIIVAYNKFIYIFIIKNNIKQKGYAYAALRAIHNKPTHTHTSI